MQTKRFTAVYSPRESDSDYELLFVVNTENSDADLLNGIAEGTLEVGFDTLAEIPDFYEGKPKGD